MNQISPRTSLLGPPSPRSRRPSLSLVPCAACNAPLEPLWQHCKRHVSAAASPRLQSIRSASGCRVSKPFHGDVHGKFGCADALTASGGARKGCGGGRQHHIFEAEMIFDHDEPEADDNDSDSSSSSSESEEDREHEGSMDGEVEDWAPGTKEDLSGWESTHSWGQQRGGNLTARSGRVATGLSGLNGSSLALQPSKRRLPQHRCMGVLRASLPG